MARLLKKIPYLAFIPIVVMYMFFPFSDFSSLYSFKISHAILSIWVTPYIIFANTLLVYFYFNPKNIKIKKELLNVIIIVVPGTMSILLLTYISIGLGLTHLFQYQTIPMIYIFIMFLFFITKKGILGIRLRFEKYHLDSALQILPSGSAVLNHALKNEITNISLSAYIAK